MADGEDYLMAPVLAGMMRLESLIDGTLDLEHVALANAALEVRAENERRVREAQEERR
jgi:hypothetical protein